MPRHKLEFDLPETEFLLFGICSQSKDYRLVWVINKNLHLHLKRDNDIVTDGSGRFARFTFENEMEKIKYCFSSNKQGGNILIKEFKQMDYLFTLEGNYSVVDPEDMLSQIKCSETVLAAYRLDTGLIKSKQYFLIGG